MGAHLARRYLGDSSGEPDPLRMPTFPPDFGFQGRKERGEANAQARPAGAARGRRKAGIPRAGFSSDLDREGARGLA